MSDQEPGLPGLTAEWHLEHHRKSPNPWAPIRVYLRTFHNINRWDLCDDDSPAWDVFRVDLGLTPADLSELTPTALGVLCSFLYRLRIAYTEEARQEVLREIGDIRDKLASGPKPDAQTRTVSVIQGKDIRLELTVGPRSASEIDIILKALKKFPAPAQAPPIICSQADIARFLGRSENTSKLLEKLEEEGIIERFEKGERKFKVWFADPERHAEALAKIPKGGRS
jgi:hypothetical protein